MDDGEGATEARSSATAGSAILPASGERPDYDSPTALAALLESAGFGMRKRYGQNFLVRRSAREKIVAAALEGVAPGDRVWEIGPGIGAMTGHALDTGVALSAFEIDPGFAALLARVYGGTPGFSLVEGDFLKTWKRVRDREGSPRAVFGNLPYNAAAAMLASLVEGVVGAPRMTFTVQKEAALRIAATPGRKDYSAFSVLCRSAYEPKALFDLGRSAFWPQPRVESAVVSLVRLDSPVSSRPGFGAFTRACFATRRKTLRNNLRGTPWERDSLPEIMRSLGFREDVRAETLWPTELAALHAAVEDAPADRA